MCTFLCFLNSYFFIFLLPYFRLTIQFIVKISNRPYFCNKKQVIINTTHCTNSNNEVVALLCLVQLSIITLFFALKDEVFPSLHSISCKSIQPTITIFIDFTACCFLFVYRCMFLLKLLLLIYFLIFLFSTFKFIHTLIFFSSALPLFHNAFFFLLLLFIFHLFHSINNVLFHLILSILIFNF